MKKFAFSLLSMRNSLFPLHWPMKWAVHYHHGEEELLSLPTWPESVCAVVSTRRSLP